MFATILPRCECEPVGLNVMQREAMTWLARSNSEVPEQIGVNHMSRVALARAGSAVQRFDAHAPHQRTDMLAPDHDAFALQQVAQHPTAGVWMVQMQFVNPAHQR